MIDSIINFFGSYSPLMNAEGIPYEGLASLNFNWIAAVLVYVISLTFVFRFIIAIFKR